MGSSISLTLWAFLGMESAAQNSDAVENPKRNVPLACMFGTLGAAVIYILSTTVIQGIVPNAELAKSTGPFGLAYATDVQPDRRLDHHGAGGRWPASARCSAGSSRSRRPAKSAADERMFPAFFSKVNAMGAPVTGMIVLGVVQIAAGAVDDLADAERAVLRAGQPRGRHQRRPLHHRAVGADGDDEGGRRAGGRHTASTWSSRWWRCSTAPTRIYASGKDAVMGGMLVTAIAFIIWGFIAPRFTHRRRLSRRADAGGLSHRQQETSQGEQRCIARGPRVIPDRSAPRHFLLSAAPVSAAGTLDRIRQNGKMLARLPGRCTALFLSG